MFLPGFSQCFYGQSKVQKKQFHVFFCCVTINLRPSNYLSSQEVLLKTPETENWRLHSLNSFIPTVSDAVMTDGFNTTQIKKKNGSHIPIRGTESDVAGMISATSSMKTVRDSKTVIPIDR